MNKIKRAYKLHIAPGRIDRVHEALRDNELIIGWSEADGLLDEKLSYESFRKILYDTYYRHQDHYIGAGSAAGSMKRFIREMNIEDYVVVPLGNSPYFYIGIVKKYVKDKADDVTGNDEVRYYHSKISDGTAYRRKVEWQKEGEEDSRPWLIPRSIASKGLQKLMNQQQTCLDASRFVDEIEDILGRLDDL